MLRRNNVMRKEGTYVGVVINRYLLNVSVKFNDEGRESRLIYIFLGIIKVECTKIR